MAQRKKRRSGLIYIVLLAALAIVAIYLYGNVQKAIYPVKYKEYVLDYSGKYGLDPYLVFAMIKVESNFRPDAVSHQNARGLMQITDQTGEWGAQNLGLGDYGSNSLYDPATNLAIGCWYMDRLLKEFDNSTELALAAYNAGSGNVNSWLKDKSLSSTGKSLDRIPFKETENYVKKVYDCQVKYYKLYGDDF